MITCDWYFCLNISISDLNPSQDRTHIIYVPEACCLYNKTVERICQVANLVKMANWSVSQEQSQTDNNGQFEKKVQRGCGGGQGIQFVARYAIAYNTNTSKCHADQTHTKQMVSCLQRFKYVLFSEFCEVFSRHIALDTDYIYRQ